jgi:hypothetical protein
MDDTFDFDISSFLPAMNSSEADQPPPIDWENLDFSFLDDSTTPPISHTQGPEDELDPTIEEHLYALPEWRLVGIAD